MKKLLVAGPTRLSGTVRFTVRKNSVLPILAACCLCCSRVLSITAWILQTSGRRLRNSEKPRLQALPGGEHRYASTLRGWAGIASSRGWLAQNALVGSIPGAFAGALFGRAELALPGGCPLGDRPIDLHVKALSQPRRALFTSRKDAARRVHKR